MTRKLSLFFFLTLIGSCLWAQPFTGSLLWQISGNGLKKPSYIVGTFHTFQDTYIDSIPHLREKLDQVDQVVGEIVISDKKLIVSKLQKKMYLPADTTYQTLLSSDYKNFDHLLTINLGVGSEHWGRVNPTIIASLLEGILFNKNHPTLNFDIMNGMDESLQKTALAQNKTVLGLETIDFQIYSLLESTTLKEQAESLYCSLQNIDSDSAEIDSIINDYKKGDLVGLDKINTNPNDKCTMSKQAEDALLDTRNKNWLKELPQIMHAKSSLIAVGCLHLVGNNGLLQQLAKLGYKIEAVKS